MFVLLLTELVTSSYSVYRLTNFIITRLVSLYSSVNNIVVYFLHVDSFATQCHQDSKQFFLSFVESLKLLDALSQLIVELFCPLVAIAVMLYWHSVLYSKSEELSVAVGDITCA